MGISAVRMLASTARASGEHGRGEEAVARLQAEFPTVALMAEPDGPGAPRDTIDLGRWQDARNDFAPFDERVGELARAGPFAFVVRGHDVGEAARLAGQVLTRWQRLLGRRNALSSTAPFDRLLRRMGELFDRAKPLVRADHDHALDTWQWMLRLDPTAGAAVQAAALLHDVERLESEADARVEHLAPSYAAFKHAHARRGAELARGILAGCGFDPGVIERASELVAAHERPGPDAERALLNDADALSFFSQNSAGYLDYFGPEQAARKIAYTLCRMRPAAAARLTRFRVRADVAALLARVSEEIRA